MSEMRDNLRVLLERILLGERLGASRGPSDRELSHAVEYALEVLDAHEEDRTLRVAQTRLRLALHLAPVDAIAYDPTNPSPRHELVREYMIHDQGLPSALVDELSRDVARVLDAWDEKRTLVTRHRYDLLRRQGGLCNNCRVAVHDGSSPLNTSQLPATLQNQDVYKPYHESPMELLAAEVDHIEPISGLGRNQIKNLQILCRLCNAGKGVGLGIDPHQEARYAKAVSEAPIRHRCQLAYYVISKSQSKCMLCTSSDHELTVRPINARGGYLRSNLYAVCVKCEYTTGQRVAG